VPGFNFYRPRFNKYGARKTEYNGRKYDSKAEAGLAQEIDLMIRAGEVLKVEPQQTFVLYGRNGGRICTHRVDFLLTMKDRSQEAWEYKGFATREWFIKQKLFTDNYPNIKYVVIR
jgi:hypothetical protein